MSKAQTTKEPLLTVGQVASELQVEANTIRIWIRSGRFPGWIKIGREWRLAPDKFTEFKRKGHKDA